MTGVVGFVSWVDQSWWVGGGQDGLDLRRSCAQEKRFHVSRGALDGSLR